MKTFVWAVFAGIAVVVVAGAVLAGAKEPSSGALLERGRYLVTVGGCNDCHTPWKMGPNGPEQDMSRMLSGHPEILVMPPAPQVTPPWGGSVSGTFTAWAGPWGVSFAANLTPDPDTGLGRWNAQHFIATMRTGRHLGAGRGILPPMPWQNLGKMTDDDLKATFAYLQSIPVIRNRVPAPIPPPVPAGTQQAAGAGAPPSAPETGTGSGSSTSGGTPQPTR